VFQMLDQGHITSPKLSQSGCHKQPQTPLLVTVCVALSKPLLSHTLYDVLYQQYATAAAAAAAAIGWQPLEIRPWQPLTNQDRGHISWQQSQHFWMLLLLLLLLPAELLLLLLLLLPAELLLLLQLLLSAVASRAAAAASRAAADLTGRLHHLRQHVLMSYGSCRHRRCIIGMQYHASQGARCSIAFCLVVRRSTVQTTRWLERAAHPSNSSMLFALWPSVLCLLTAWGTPSDPRRSLAVLSAATHSAEHVSPPLSCRNSPLLRSRCSWRQNKALSGHHI